LGRRRTRGVMKKRKMRMVGKLNQKTILSLKLMKRRRKKKMKVGWKN